ncbi:hypothetical protein [Fortiea contorta]|uniref:hypothetical protein n=1 Tax=Fortiea contorta TaxID=1892405 RepID=UPI00034AF8E5|nr:hypothetical protein [Fortiea contorta]
MSFDSTQVWAIALGRKLLGNTQRAREDFNQAQRINPKMTKDYLNAIQYLNQALEIYEEFY